MNHATLAQLGSFLTGLGILPPSPDRPALPPAMQLNPAIQQQRRDILSASAAARIYVPPITALAQELAAIPGAFIDDAELNRLIEEDDAIHDSYYAAAYFLAEAYRHAPALPHLAQPMAAAVRIQTHFTPKLAHTRAPSARQAEAAHLRLPLLETYRADLEALPVAGGSVFDWLRTSIEAAINLNARLEQRDLNRSAGTPDRTRLITVRTDLISELARFRAALADEARAGHLPPNTEALIFGPLDALLART